MIIRTSAPRSALRFAALLVFLPLVLTAPLGCKRGGGNKAAFPLATPAEAQHSLVASITWPTAEGTLAEVEKIAKRLGFPFSAADGRAALLARSPIPAALVERVDLAKPVSAVVLARSPDGKPVGTDGGAATGATPPPAIVFAFAAKAAPNDPKSGDAAAALVAALGTPIDRRQDAVAVKWPPGADAGVRGDASTLDEATSTTIYLLVRDGVVVAGDSWDSLRNGGAAALDARAAASGSGLRATLWPEGLARAAGTTVAAAVAKARDAVGAERKGGGNALSPLLDAYVNEVFDGIFGLAPTIEAGTLGIDVTERTGLSLSFGVRPRAGSTLAKLAAEAKPYAWDPSVLAGGGTPLLAAAVGPNTVVRALLPAMLRVLAKAGLPGDQQAAVGAFLTSYANDLTGEMSIVMDVADAKPGQAPSPFGYRGTFKLAPGVDGKAWLARARDMAKQPWVTTLVDAAFASEEMGGRKLAFTVENDGDALVTRMSLAVGKGAGKAKAKPKKAPGRRGAGDPGAATRAILDAWFKTSLEVRAVAAGDRILIVCGADTKAQMARMLDAGGSAGAPPPALDRTLASTKGSWGFEHLDFAALMRMSLAFSGADPQAARTMAPFAALLEGAAAPLHLTWSGGGEMSSTVTVPIETAAWVASVIPRVMAMSQGAGGAH